MQPLRLHRFALSGHSHRVELMLTLLDVPHVLVDVDLGGGAHKTPAYLALNAFGQVPVLEDGDLVLPDSNAILVYLAERYDPTGRWAPRDRVAAARVQRWLSAAAGPLAAGPAAARAARLFRSEVNGERAAAIAAQLFGVLEGELATNAFLVGDHPTIADIALYTYIAHAPEGGISLDAHPHVRNWLARIEALPRFIPMLRSPQHVH